MKILFLVALLLVPSLSWGQDDINLTVVAHGPVVRGKITDFSIMAGSSLRNIVGINLQIETVYGGIHIPLIGKTGEVALEKGSLLEGKSLIITGPKATGTAVLDKKHSEASSNTPFNVTFGEPVSGPGELFRFKGYMHIHAKPWMGNPISPEKPSLVILAATDPEGESMALTTRTVPTVVDLRPFGDLNNDQLLTIADAIRLLRYLVGLSELTESEKWYADVQHTSVTGSLNFDGRYLGNGSVDVADVSRMLQVMTGIWETWWPDPKP